MARSLRSETATPTPRMAGRVKTIASVTFDDIRHRLHIVNCIEPLRRLEQVLCLRLTRQPCDSTRMDGATGFLGAVLEILQVPNATAREFKIEEIIAGSEWRRRPPEGDLPPLWTGCVARKMLGLCEFSSWRSVPLNPEVWGEPVIENEHTHSRPLDLARYLLIVHPWGPDAIHFVKLPEGDLTVGDMRSTPSAHIIHCQLCSCCVDDCSKSLCLFHPGKFFINH